MSGGLARTVLQFLPFMEFFAELSSKSSCLILNTPEIIKNNMVREKLLSLNLESLRCVFEYKLFKLQST